MEEKFTTINEEIKAEIVVKKSRFIAEIFYAETEKEAEEIIEKVINKINSPQSKFETGKNRALNSQEFKLEDNVNVEEAIRDLKDILTINVEDTDIVNIENKLNEYKSLFNSASAA